MLTQKLNLNDNTRDALQEIFDHIQSQDTVQGLKEISESILNAFMLKDRNAFLRTASEDNKGNGYYNRTLSTGLGKIDLVIPRDRLNLFRPFLLPEQWQRGDQTYDDLLKSLIFHSYSPNKIRSILKSLGVHYSAQDVEELKDEIYQRSLEFRARQLNENAFCLYIDAYHTQIRDAETSKISKCVIHTVIGIDMNGKKEIYGYYDFMGAESKEYWLRVLNDLLKRGLKRVLTIISDDFSGLTDAIDTLFPKTEHQLCFVHLQRNVKRNMGRNDYRNFLDTLSTLKAIKDFDAALIAFKNLCQKYADKYPHFIEHIKNRAERYLTFLKYPQSVQKHIYTTNVAENINSRLEVLRINLGGYFQSAKTLSVAIQVLVDKLHSQRWLKSLPAFMEAEYEIYQLFGQRFEMKI